MALNVIKKVPPNKKSDQYILSDKIHLEKQNMINTQCLYLKNSNITELPHDFFTLLPNLKWLDLRNNFISAIPKSIENHKCLETFLLSDNNISHLPAEMCTVKSLKYIQLSGNPLRFPKYVIVNSGIDVLKEYLQIFYNKRQNIADNVMGSRSICNLTGERNWKNSTKGVSKQKHEKCNDSLKGAQIIKRKPLNSERYVQLPKSLSKMEMTKRIEEKAGVETFVEKKTKRLSDIENTLQKAKSLDQLKRWREKYKKEKVEQPKIACVADMAHFPYGTDKDCDKILTKSELLKIQETLNKKQQIERHERKYKVSEVVTLDAKMLELENVLKEIDVDQNGDSPMKHQETISEVMKKLMELQKKILQLKLENDNFNTNNC